MTGDKTTTKGVDFSNDFSKSFRKTQNFLWQNFSFTEEVLCVSSIFTGTVPAITMRFSLTQSAERKAQVELKAGDLWEDYEVFPLISSSPKEDKYPVDISPNYVATFFDWYYSTESGKWFIPEEPVPLPQSECESSKSFKINYELKEITQLNAEYLANIMIGYLEV